MLTCVDGLFTFSSFWSTHAKISMQNSLVASISLVQCNGIFGSDFPIGKVFIFEWVLVDDEFVVLFWWLFLVLSRLDPITCSVAGLRHYVVLLQMLDLFSVILLQIMLLFSCYNMSMLVLVLDSLLWSPVLSRHAGISNFQGVWVFNTTPTFLWWLKPLANMILCYWLIICFWTSPLRSGLGRLDLNLLWFISQGLLIYIYICPCWGLIHSPFFKR